MTPEQRLLARHALGMDITRNKTSYRNRYYARTGSPQYLEWMRMCVKGWAEAAVQTEFTRHQTRGFWLTRAGAELAIGPGETLDPEDFPIPPPAEA